MIVDVKTCGECKGLQLVSYQLSSDDFTDGNTVKLPREQKGGADNG